METLADRIARDGPLNELDAVGWVIRLAKRLEGVHSLGVAHGSVSPRCVHTAGVPRTSAGMLADVMGTAGDVSYHSPERVLGGSVSQADDVWAVGVTLYLVLTGTHPFAADTEAETRQRILTGAPAPLAIYDVGDDDLQGILETLLTRDAARVTSMVRLRAELESWHPDPTVKELGPLSEEEPTNNDDDDQRTVMRSASDPLPPVRVNARPAAPAPAAMARASRPDLAPPAAGALRISQLGDSDDDDDDARTMMRSADPMAGGPIPPAAGSGGGLARPRPAAGRAMTPAGNRTQGATAEPEVVRLSETDRPGDHPTQVVSAVELFAQARALAKAGEVTDEDDDDEQRTILRASDDDDDDEAQPTRMREASHDDGGAQTRPGFPAARPPAAGAPPSPPSAGSNPRAASAARRGDGPGNASPFSPAPFGAREAPAAPVPQLFGAPPKPGFGAPAASSFGSPSPSGGGAPGQPGFGAPGQPGFGAPGQPGIGAPPKPGFGAPAQSGFGEPAQSGFGEPAQSGFGAPAQSGFGEPAQSPFGAPAQSGFGEPAQSGFGEPHAGSSMAMSGGHAHTPGPAGVAGSPAATTSGFGSHPQQAAVSSSKLERHPAGNRGALIAMLVALLIAIAAGTFLFLRYRGF